MDDVAPRRTPDPFWAVFWRKSGEAVDLAGKGIVGISGWGSLGGGPKADPIDWRRLAAGVLIGSAVVVVGIYLQAKAEES